MFAIFVLIVSSIIISIGSLNGGNILIVMCGLLFGILGILVHILMSILDVLSELKERK